MSETYFIRDLLLPEFELEIEKTHRLFEALPTGQEEFKPYEKSMTLGRLAGHTTDLFLLVALTLTTAELDMAAAWRPYTMRSKEELLARLHDNTSLAQDAIKHISDNDFHHSWVIKRGASTLYSGERFTYFRNQGINQIVHHRAQLGTYIRALGMPLPGMYGASADGI